MRVAGMCRDTCDIGKEIFWCRIHSGACGDEPDQAGCNVGSETGCVPVKRQNASASPPEEMDVRHVGREYETRAGGERLVVLFNREYLPVADYLPQDRAWEVHDAAVGDQERYSIPHVIEKKKRPRPASNAS